MTNVNHTSNTNMAHLWMPKGCFDVGQRSWDSAGLLREVVPVYHLKVKLMNNLSFTEVPQFKTI